MEISTRLKSAFKLSLTMVLAYGIALSMDWDRPYWAGLAIANCSLTTFGDSINKGVLRLAGTALAIIVALTLISLFQQDRWMFVAALSAWIALCSYMMIGTSRFYFWQVAGFVVPILVVNGGPHPVSDFDIFVLRAQQTVLGVLCFSVVYSLLWPGSSRERFEDNVAECISLQRALIASALEKLSGKQNREALSELCLKITEQYAQLKSLLDAATLDSFAIWDRRVGWHHIIEHLSLTEQEIHRLRVGLGDLKNDRQTKEVQALREALLEIDERLHDAQKILNGSELRARSVSANIASKEQWPTDLPHFERAALSVAAHHANRALELSETLKAEVAEVRDKPVGALPAETQVEKVALPKRRFFDPDAWILVLRVQLIFLLGVICTFYVPGYPSAPLLICVSVSVPLGILLMPQVSARVVLIPALLAIALFGILHMIVMPVLITFEQLATMLFVTTFIVAYFTSRPDQMLLRIIGTNLMVLCLQIDNEQQYSFIFFVVVVVGLLSILAIVETTRYLPVSLIPERRVEALLRRFFASSEYLIRHSSRVGAPEPRGLQGWLLHFHLAEIQTIPRKLIPWLNAIPQSARRIPAQGDATHIAASLEALSKRIVDFVKARRLAQAEPLLAGGEEAMRRWRLGVADVASGLVSDPGSAMARDLETRLSRGVSSLEETVERVLNEVPTERLKPDDFDNMYRALGAYRGLAEGVVEYARRAAAIDWPKLRESRF